MAAGPPEGTRSLCRNRNHKVIEEGYDGHTNASLLKGFCGGIKFGCGNKGAESVAVKFLCDAFQFVVKGVRKDNVCVRVPRPGSLVAPPKREEPLTSKWQAEKVEAISLLVA